MKTIRLFLCLLGMLTIASRVDAGTLFASSAAGGPGELYILNSANGTVVQDVGPLNDVAGGNYPITGLAFHPTTGVLYGSTGNSVAGKEAQLVTIDPATAQVTLIGSYNAGPTNSSGKPATMADISFDSAGNLYGVGSIGGPNLYSINTATGQATVIGSNGVSTSSTGGGLAISPSGVFNGTPTSTRFGTYDSVSGAFTNIAAPARPAGGGYGGLAYDGSVLYGMNVGSGSPPPAHLVIIDPVDGTVTDLGLSDVTSLDAIAFRPIPEPATFVLLSVSMCVFMTRKRG
ncbi:DUF4394 domain-containing protein [Bythopirellula polymerisocia]|uniref:PEP-CTERM protein-sorting domain-containing protein n=1 Tax=Bythopirellula polymerisocia TaxID=2528003 RepID=A0A5C6CB77_9BACT|nr:DUF4394 domain-containing protein [Bythopirellula polymerisocia]TWU21880.1 hypothetical protein Pla144_43140 [Bythopirellula polymerisocia]